MVALGWKIDRVFLLIVYSVLTLLCTFQIYRARMLAKVESKNYVHYWNCLSAILLLTASVDADGVFQLYGPITYNVIAGLGSWISMLVLCIIIMSHFRAHYISLRKDMPTTFLWILLAYIVVLVPLTCLEFIANNLLNTSIYSVPLYIYNFSALFLVLTYDVWGFSKIRTLMHEAIRLEKPNFTTSISWLFQKSEHEKTSGGSVKIDYEDLLRHFVKFHMVVIILVGVATLNSFSLVVTILKNPYAPEPRPDPNNFTLDGTIHAAGLPLILFIWWAWLPMTGDHHGSHPSPTSVHTNNNSKVHGSSPSDHHPHGMHSGQRSPSHDDLSSSASHPPYEAVPLYITDQSVGEFSSRRGDISPASHTATGSPLAASVLEEDPYVV